MIQVWGDTSLWGLNLSWFYRSLNVFEKPSLHWLRNIEYSNQGGKNLPGATFSVYKKVLMGISFLKIPYWLHGEQRGILACMSFSNPSRSRHRSRLWMQELFPGFFTFVALVTPAVTKTQNHVAAYGADRYLSLLFPVLSGVVLNLILSLKLAGVVFSDLAFHEGASFREYLHVGRRITVSHLAYNLLFFLLYTCWVHWIKPKAI